MTTLTSTPPPVPSDAAGATRRERRRGKLVQRAKLYTALFLLILPTFGGTVLFNYWPKLDTFKYSLYKWDGGAVFEQYIDWNNFAAMWGDSLFKQTFALVGILFVANLFKMWPSIFAAVVLHRLRSERWQYIYRILFVIPMVIPGLVWMLIWKQFFDPNLGLLNAFLNGTGLMEVLHRLDGIMPRVGTVLGPLRVAALDLGCGSVWGAGLLSFLLLWVGYAEDWATLRQRWVWAFLVLLVAAAVVGPIYAGVFIVLTAALALLAREPVIRIVIRRFGFLLLGAALFFLLTTMIWTAPIGAFADGAPGWLGHSKLIIPSIVFWGFPWVGTIGVLLYLASLSGISQDVYEAAELDGVGPFGKFFRIELPLILRMVRINLVFMTIGTLNDYGLFLVLLGIDGGPGNVGMVPGLYMFKEAYINQNFGYACALGVAMFALILFITFLYERYVKVEK